MNEPNMEIARLKAALEDCLALTYDYDDPDASKGDVIDAIRERAKRALLSSAVAERLASRLKSEGD